MQTTVTLRQFTRRAQTTIIGLGLLARGFSGAVALGQTDLRHQHAAAPVLAAPVSQGLSYDDFRYYDENTELPSSANAPAGIGDAAPAPITPDRMKFLEQNTQLPDTQAIPVQRGGPR